MSEPGSRGTPRAFRRPTIAAMGCAALLLLAGSLYAGEVVRDEKRQLKFVVPNGFVPAPPELRRPEFAHSYVRDAENPERTLFIRIRGVAGQRVANHVLSDAELQELKAQLPGAERFTEEWKWIRMDGIKAVVTDETGLQYLTYTLPLSTQPEVLIVDVCGPVSRDSDIRAVLKELLLTFDATPDLQTPSQAQARPPRFVLRNKHLVLAGGGFLVVVIGGYLLLRPRRLPPLVLRP